MRNDKQPRMQQGSLLDMIDEPIAVALALGLNKAEEKTVAVYHLGGSTFNISILKIQNGIIKVVSTNGDTTLGGENFDAQLVEYIVDKFKKDQGIDVSGDPRAISRIRDAAEKAKIELSSTAQTEISLPFITVDRTGPKHLHSRLTRAMFESLCEGQLRNTLELCEKALKDAGVNFKDLDDVVLVGGMSHVPTVIDTLGQFFNRVPIRSEHPDETVVIGAAIHGGNLVDSATDIRKSHS
jgi:molecular chaperone DnaK